MSATVGPLGESFTVAKRLFIRTKRVSADWKALTAMAGVVFS